MNTLLKMIFCSTLILSSINVFGQEQNYYLGKINEYLSEKNCEGAQTMYNLYKKIEGKSNEAIEKLIKECQLSTNNSVARGPAGGFIFYDKGYYSDGWRYLECSPTDVGIVLHIDDDKGGINVDSEVGKGKENTMKIINAGKSNIYADWYNGAVLCYRYTHNGYNDWYLPNRAELKLVYDNLASNGVGDFTTEGRVDENGNYITTVYMSSNYHAVHNLDFEDGEDVGGAISYIIRAVRRY